MVGHTYIYNYLVSPLLVFTTWVSLGQNSVSEHWNRYFSIGVCTSAQMHFTFPYEMSKILLKGNGYPSIGGNSVRIVFLPSGEKSTLKRKNLLPCVCVCVCVGGGGGGGANVLLSE